MTRATGIRSTGPVSLRDVRRNRQQFAELKDRLAPVSAELLDELAANKAALAGLREQIAVNTAERRELLAKIEADRLARRAAHAGLAVARRRERNRRGNRAGYARRKIARARARLDDFPKRLTPAQFAAIRPALQQEATALGIAPRDVSTL